MVWTALSLSFFVTCLHKRISTLSPTAHDLTTGRSGLNPCRADTSAWPGCVLPYEDVQSQELLGTRLLRLPHKHKPASAQNFHPMQPVFVWIQSKIVAVQNTHLHRGGILSYSSQSVAWFSSSAERFGFWILSHAG